MSRTTSAEATELVLGRRLRRRRLRVVNQALGIDDRLLIQAVDGRSRGANRFHEKPPLHQPFERLPRLLDPPLDEVIEQSPFGNPLEAVSRPGIRQVVLENFTGTCGQMAIARVHHRVFSSRGNANL